MQVNQEQKNGGSNRGFARVYNSSYLCKDYGQKEGKVSGELLELGKTCLQFQLDLVVMSRSKSFYMCTLLIHQTDKRHSLK